MRTRRLFWVYLTLVSVTGFTVGALRLTQPGAFDAVEDRIEAFLLLSALLLAGEMRPVRLLRLPKLSAEPPPPSTTYVFALLLVFGLPGAALAHGVVSMIEDVVHRKPLYKVLFNVGQYVLSLQAAALVFEVGGWPLADEAFGAGDVPVTVAAAATYYLVNNALIGVVVGLFTGERVTQMILFNVRDQGWMEWLLLCLGPLAAMIAVASPLLLPLLLLPSLTIFASSRSVLEMERRERTDALTALPNRSGFAASVEESLAGGSAAGSIVLLDLDRFKYVNDTLGYALGDHLLEEVAARLAQEVDDVDVVARLGGDEFALFSSVATTSEAAGALARRSVAALAQPFSVDGLDLAIEASAGVAVAPTDGRSADDLLRRAEIALYVSKSSPEQVTLYDASLDQHSRRRLRLLGELRAAINDGHLVLHFQPQADLATGEISGLEALVRWEHPELGLIAPDEFVALAEHSTLIGPLTEWVLEAAIAEARRQLDQRRVLRMAVNVSARGLHDRLLPVALADMLRRYDVSAGMLTVEVTESAVADLGAAAKVLNTLATMGIGVAIDDFGTGYSSLTYLRQLPVSEIKLDKSFVAELHNDRADTAIVRSTIELAQYLNLTSVAEGVESQDVYDTLHALGCTRVQGFLIAKPMPSDQLSEWLVDQPAARLDA